MTPNKNLKFKEPNIFRVDGGHLKPTNLHPMSIRCPHCRELGSFDQVGPAAVAFQKHGTVGATVVHAPATACIRICPNISCRGLIFAVESNGVIELEPPQLLDFQLENLPSRLQVTLQEAVACHGAGAYRAAAMMVRRLLEEICDENNAAGANLHQRLASLKGAVVLPQLLFEAMDELKALGNDATHVEAKSYDQIGASEAEDSIELAKEILKALYQLKGLIGRLQARKKP